MQTPIVCAWTEAHNVPEDSTSLERDRTKKSYLAHYLSRFISPQNVIWSGKLLFKNGIAIKCQTAQSYLLFFFFIPFPLVICAWGLCCLVFSGHKRWGRTDMMSGGDDTWPNTGRQFVIKKRNAGRVRQVSGKMRKGFRERATETALTKYGKRRASAKLLTDNHFYFRQSVAWIWIVLFLTE